MGRNSRKRVKPSQTQPEVPPKPISRPVRLSYEYVVPGKEFCLSHCGKDDIRETADCLRQLTTLTWQQVLQSGGKPGNKQGLGYTPYKDSALRHVQRPARLDPEIQIAGIRASQKMRVFGAYLDHVFYLLWFDPNHEIVGGD
jgi:hypothetical protein